mmetsp:Transcript_25006/g.45935  ORF Transcript_25006/g.45935 Transcript_25006/m.45935 type:complete len:128 (-) Transcript_25006:174-557(-)
MRRRGKAVWAPVGFLVVAGCLLAVRTAGPAAARVAKSPPGRVVMSKDGGFFARSLRVEEFEDPKVSGVKLYISKYSRWDPGATGLECVVTGRVTVAADVLNQTDQEGEELFRKSNSTCLESLEVRRI